MDNILNGSWVNSKESLFKSPNDPSLQYNGDNSSFNISGSDLTIDGIDIAPGIHKLKPGQVVRYSQEHDFAISEAC